MSKNGAGYDPAIEDVPTNLYEEDNPTCPCDATSQRPYPCTCGEGRDGHEACADHHPKDDLSEDNL